MAKINDRFQLTNYGSEVQQAIDNALIHLPAELALKAYRDEVLTKNQIIPYTPTAPYHPATKLYCDEANDATNTRLDDEIARATAAEKNLNEKQVLTNDNGTYKYINLSTLTTTQALVDENALDAKLGELSLGFFVFYQVKADGTLVEESKDDTGNNPYSIVNAAADLPTTGVPANSLALVLKNNTNIDVYKYTTSWSVLSTPTIENGWLFAEESTGHGFYWFQNTWNKVDMNVDMNEYYKKTEIDTMLTGYVQKVTLGDLADLTTSVKTTIVGAINSVKSLADTKDTLPTIPAYSALVNNTGSAGKPNGSVVVSSNAAANTIAGRTSTGTLIASNATANNELTTLGQVNDMFDNISLGGYQPIIKAGSPDDIVAYSGTAGTLNTLGRITSINATLASTSNIKIPTEKAVANYVQNYKPIIITQGNSNTSVTTNQLTFWIEN